MKKNWAGALCAGLLGLSMIATANGAAVSGQGTWETTLLGRDLDGDASTFEAYYDTDLKVTWLASGNAGSLMTWSDANAWAAGLDVNGVTGWRLPNIVDVGIDGPTYTSIWNGTDYGYNIDTSTSELAHLFYDTLGNLAYRDENGVYQPGFGLSNTGPFSDLQSKQYWSGTEYAPAAGNAWYFYFYNGKQEAGSQGLKFKALAVRPGDVMSPVPVPAAVWLFGSAMVGLIGLARRKS